MEKKSYTRVEAIEEVAKVYSDSIGDMNRRELYELTLEGFKGVKEWSDKALAEQIFCDLDACGEADELTIVVGEESYTE